MTSEKELDEQPTRKDTSVTSGSGSIHSKETIGHSEDPEKQREKVRHANPDGYSRTAGGINVQESEAEFAQLQRELSGISHMSRQLSRTQSRHSSHKEKAGKVDIEKIATSSESASDDEPFDLESTLRGNKDAEVESGIRPKHIGVLWDGLTVTGTGGVTNFVKTFPDAFISFFNVFETGMQILGLGKKGKDVNILKDFRGVVKPGELVLVLGRPGSGCTTFLKVIANQRFGYTGVHGDVQYGPFDAETFAKEYRGEAVYNQEDDIHHPTLTVGQTLGFALDTKTPGKRPHGMSKSDFKDKVVTTLLRMFNIEVRHSFALVTKGAIAPKFLWECQVLSDLIDLRVQFNFNKWYFVLHPVKFLKNPKMKSCYISQWFEYITISTRIMSSDTLITLSH